ncbi:HAD-IB family phosphatase [Miltoncostaea marina]|uniref:HAD-IB family phosphatase n=1 Tax=Miltoncostaea marina TaxID=2843215 RepID=UPI001FE39003|nr:HAD-IB family phosphatase [Miltoncostaea marina]
MLLIACDFDGTITRHDTLHLIVETFGERGLWQAIEPRLRAGEVTLEQAMQEEFDTVRATPEQVRDLVLREAGLRDGFPELVAWAHERGHRLIVFSSGFRSVIEAALEHWGLGHLHVESHEAVFTPEGCRLVWSDRGDRCDECGRHCKRHDLRAHARRGERLVYIGDGVSDRCGAAMADVVFARAHLARDLAEDGVPFLPFEDFVEVRERLERVSTLAA